MIARFEIEDRASLPFGRAMDYPFNIAQTARNDYFLRLGVEKRICYTKWGCELGCAKTRRGLLRLPHLSG